MVINNKHIYQNFKQIMKLFLKQHIEILFHLNSNTFQYPFNFKNFVNENYIKRTVIQKLVLWYAIVLVLILSNILNSKLVTIYENATCINNSSKILLMACATIILLEFFWLITLKQLSCNKYRPLFLFDEYFHLLDNDFKLINVSKFIYFFNIVYFCKNLYFKFIMVILYLNTGNLIFFTFWFFCHKLINIFEFFLYIYLITVLNFVGGYCIFFTTSFYLNIIFMTKIFKYKLKLCQITLRKLILTNNNLKTYVFNFQFLTLHRHLNMFNVFTSRYIWLCDILFKISFSLTTSSLLLQKNSKSNSTFFKIAILFMYFVGYGCLNVSLIYLASFPSESLKMYKIYNKLLFTNNVKYRLRKNKCLFSVYNHLKNVKICFCFDSMIQILGKNKFSFSYLSCYLLTYLFVAENVIGNIYFVMLVCNYFKKI